jgi:hypothetical protein
MGDSQDRRAAEIQDSIRQILYRDWDPVSVCDVGAECEYDSYISGVYRILATLRSEGALIDFFKTIESDLLSLDAATQGRLRRVVRKLLALDVKL